MTGLFTTGLIWGCVLMLVGFITLVNVIFDVHIPIFRILFALFLIHLGVRMLTGTSSKQEYYYSSCYSAQGTCTEKNIVHYNTVFNKQIIDITNPDLLPNNTSVEINTAFGESIILVDTTLPLKIDASSAFGSIELPDNTHLSFGRKTYQTQQSEKPINIKAKVAFGKSSIIDKKNYNRPMNEKGQQ